MRYFKLDYPSKQTRHPDGKKTVSIYQDGLHKKNASELAIHQLQEIEGENAELFKLPKITELTLEQFEVATIDKPEAEKIKAENAEIEALQVGFDNLDEEKGLTLDDLKLNCAAIMLFDKQDEYSNAQVDEITDFAENPLSGTIEEYKAFEQLMIFSAEYMPQIFDKINADMLLQLIETIDITIKADGEKRVPQAVEMLISENWGLPFQTAICDSNYKDVSNDQATIKQIAETQENEADKELQLFEIPKFKAPAKVCTFDADLSDLNGKLAALSVGESLILDNLSNELYHASEGYSKSTLDLLALDASLVEWSKNAPIDKEKIKALDVGDALHTKVLEPQEYEKRYAIEPAVLNEHGKPTTKTNKHWKAKNAEFIEANKDKTIITDDDNKKIALMAGSVMAHPTAKKLFVAGGIAEQSIFYRLSESIVLKIRPDWQINLNGRLFMIDLKSCCDVFAFEKSIAEYNYHVQDAFYSYVYEKATGNAPIFGFCAVSKSISCGKYPARLVVLDGYDKEMGLDKVYSNIETLKQCLTSGVWGGFETVSRPAWARKQDTNF